MGGFIVGVLLRVVLQGQLPVCILDVIQSCVPVQAQSSIVGVERIGIVLAEKLFLRFVHNPMLIEEPMESRVSVFQGVLLAE